MINRAAQATIFHPESILWRINCDVSVYLGGSRALLLQLAHPLVAAGVAAHSNFKERPLQRLHNTLRILPYLSFGTLAQAQRSSQAINRCHTQVIGVLHEEAGIFPAGTPYAADAPELKLWVFATLIDSALAAYDALVSPLSPEVKAQYYAQTNLVAAFMGIPRRLYPPTYPDFTAYMQEMIECTLCVSETGRTVAHALFDHHLIGPLAYRTGFIGLGMMPAHLRDEFEFAWTERHERMYQRAVRLLRTAHRILPDALWVHPISLIQQVRYKRPTMEALQ